MTDFLEQFKSLPEGRYNGGYLEVGEWDGDDYEYETQVDFRLAPDGSVWAKVCDSPDELPMMDNVSHAWSIILERNSDLHLTELINERAWYHGEHFPRTVEHALFWIEDEAAVQRDQIEQAADQIERDERTRYAEGLEAVANKIRQIGFVPQAIII